MKNAFSAKDKIDSDGNIDDEIWRFDDIKFKNRI